MIAQAIGMLGALCIVLAYWMLIECHWHSKSKQYLLTNLSGAVLLIISLCFNFNLGSMAIEWFWVAISITGLYRAWRSPC